MKLIIENINGEIYCYIEKEKHFARLQKTRRTARIVNPKLLLDEDCTLGNHLDNNTHMVFNLGKPIGA